MVTSRTSASADGASAASSSWHSCGLSYAAEPCWLACLHHGIVQPSSTQALHGTVAAAGPQHQRSCS